ncbi:MAG: sulfotransferase family 2 domain-containing protein [Candidatus Sedimenticola sp. (ex Thyasira tokunagai)]
MINYWRRPAAGSVPALFLHIQKTAGTSIVDLARQYYGESITSHGECWGLPPEQFRRVGFVSGHLGYDYTRHLIGQRFAFTFLREPAERILSMYYFCRSRDPAEFDIYRKAHEMDLLRFLEAGLSEPFMKMLLWNNQVWQLAHGYTHLDDRRIDDFTEAELLRLAKEHIAEFSYVGFTETFADDARVVLKALGIPKPKEMPVSNAIPMRPRAAEQPLEVKAMLDKLTELDRQLYDYAWKQFSVARRKKNGGWWRWG